MGPKSGLMILPTQVPHWRQMSPCFPWRRSSLMYTFVWQTWSAQTPSEFGLGLEDFGVHGFGDLGVCGLGLRGVKPSSSAHFKETKP